MLPKKNRLNLKKDFQWVASGSKLSNNLVKLLICFRDLESGPRIGIATSKTIFKKAVYRNRARRLVSKGLENLYNKLPDGINIIAMPKESVLSLSSEEVTQKLEELLRKAGLLK